VSALTLFDDGSERVRARVRRLAEPAQVDPEQLRLFSLAGLRPGAMAEFMYSDGTVIVKVDSATNSDPIPIELPAHTAAHVFVARTA
jgi:DtxR family Mn-dependent transcriptional regulator